MQSSALPETILSVSGLTQTRHRKAGLEQKDQEGFRLNRKQAHVPASCPLRIEKWREKSKMLNAESTVFRGRRFHLAYESVLDVAQSLSRRDTYVRRAKWRGLTSHLEKRRRIYHCLQRARINMLAVMTKVPRAV